MGLLFRRRRPIARLADTAATTGVEGGAGPAAPAQYVAPPPGSTGGEVDELSRLVQMHEAGALSDAEFTAAKAQLLGI
jgi:hypothetical protein